MSDENQGAPIPEDDNVVNRGRYGKYWDKKANVKLRRMWYGWFIIFALVLLVAAAVDIMFVDEKLKWGIIGALGVLVIIAFLMLFTRTNEFAEEMDTGELEEAMLQCPECNTIFDMKETHFREHIKGTSFSCPHCGNFGSLPGIDAQPIKKRIPEGELRAYSYQCTGCNEIVELGVFGRTDIFRSEFRTCPHCGEKDTFELLERAPPPPEETDEEKKMSDRAKPGAGG